MIDGERDYQETRRAENKSSPHEIAAYILYMRNYLAEAETIATRIWTPDCGDATLDVLRKVVALGIACFEAHGVPPRAFHVPASAGITGEMHATAAFDLFAPVVVEPLAPAKPLPSTPVAAVPEAS